MTLLFDFAVDKASATITITREFDANLDLVWDAWTKAEILDQWIAPKPWKAKTKEMDFREGGRWLYCMISPDNVVAGWSLANFTSIKPKTSFTTENSFSNEKGEAVQEGFTSSLTITTFKAGPETTTVQVVKKMASLAELEKFVALGFKEGMAAAMSNLDNLLATSKGR